MSPLSGHRDGFRRLVHPKHEPVWADKTRRQERDIAGPASHVKHAHAASEARESKHVRRQVADEPSLKDKSVQFLL